MSNPLEEAGVPHEKLSYGNWTIIVYDHNVAEDFSSFPYNGGYNPFVTGKMRYETDEVLIDEPQGVQLTESIGYQFAAWPVELEQDGYYHISVTLKDDVGGTDFYVDFFADGFASSKQVSWFTTEKGEKTYEAILPSGDAYSVEGILFRIIVITESTDVAVTETKLEKVTPI